MTWDLLFSSWNTPTETELFIPMATHLPNILLLSLSNSIKWYHHPCSCSIQNHTLPPALIHYHLDLQNTSEIHLLFTTLPLSPLSMLLLCSQQQSVQRGFHVSTLILVVGLSPYSSHNIFKTVNQITSFLFSPPLLIPSLHDCSPAPPVKCSSLHCLVFHFHCSPDLLRSLSLFMQTDSFLMGKKRPKIFTDLRILSSVYCFAGGELPRQPSPSLKLRQWNFRDHWWCFFPIMCWRYWRELGKIMWLGEVGRLVEE